MPNILIIGKDECSMEFTFIKGHGCFMSLKQDPTGEFHKNLFMEHKTEKGNSELDYALMNKRIDSADAVVSFLNPSAIDLMIDQLVSLRSKMVWEGGYPIEEYDEEVQIVLNKLGGK